MQLACDAILDEEIYSYLQGDIDPDREEVVERHIASCFTCRERAIDLRALGEILGDASSNFVLPEIGEEVRRDLRRLLARARYDMRRQLGWGVLLILLFFLILAALHVAT